MTPFIQVDTTTATRQEAELIARELVSQRLVACAHIIGPIKSIYRWKGQVQEDEEWHGVFKTRQSLLEEVTTVIKQLHSYECPKLISLPIAEGSADYLAWLDDELMTDDK